MSEEAPEFPVRCKLECKDCGEITLTDIHVPESSIEGLNNFVDVHGNYLRIVLSEEPPN